MGRYLSSRASCILVRWPDGRNPSGASCFCPRIDIRKDREIYIPSLTYTLVYVGRVSTPIVLFIGRHQALKTLLRTSEPCIDLISLRSRVHNAEAQFTTGVRDFYLLPIFGLSQRPSIREPSDTSARAVSILFAWLHESASHMNVVPINSTANCLRSTIYFTIICFYPDL